MIVDIGRVCIKTMGHEADEKCVVVDTDKGNFVIVAGPRVKKRRCNIAHLEILPHKLDIKKGATEKEVADALSRAGLVSEKELPKKPEGYTPKPPAAKKQETPVKPAEKKKIPVKAKK